MATEITAALKQHARDQLGFDLVGVTTAAPADGGVRLADWLAAGRHGEMAWIAETASVRTDPGRFLPGARSVVCVAMSYHDRLEAAELAPAGDHAVIARYARRKDYHGVIRPRLARLGRFLAARVPGSRWRVAVDSAPLLERELAARAGLGWIGKNTCLIDRRHGSELLLGELVTTVELAPDPAQQGRCGTCTACLRACPTGALVAPGVLDSRRCIAYLTVEHRTEIPAPLAAAIGPHLFGCDVCQTVCPWNRRALPRTCATLCPRPRLSRPTTRELAGMLEPDFLAFAAGTPLRRLGYLRFRRNLAVVAGDAAAAATTRDDP